MPTSLGIESVTDVLAFQSFKRLYLASGMLRAPSRNWTHNLCDPKNPLEESKRGASSHSRKCEQEVLGVGHQEISAGALNLEQGLYWLAHKWHSSWRSPSFGTASQVEHTGCLSRYGLTLTEYFYSSLRMTKSGMNPSLQIYHEAAEAGMQAASFVVHSRVRQTRHERRHNNVVPFDAGPHRYQAPRCQ